MKCAYERLTYRILDLCNKLCSYLPNHEGINQNCMEMIDSLIKMKPSAPVYIKLLNLHKLPHK